MSENYGNRFKDISGKEFGKLTVIKRISPVGERVVWDCECECGKRTRLPTTYLTSGDTQSCGCIGEKQSRINLREEYDNKRIDDVFVPSLTRKVNKSSKSGYKGVNWNKAKGKWVARLRLKGKDIYLGAYDEINDAIKARKNGEERYFKPYINKLEEKQHENK